MNHWKNLRGNKNYLETNKKENMIQNQWFVAKPVLRGKFTSLPQETRKKISNNLNLHLKKLEKEQKVEARES